MFFVSVYLQLVMSSALATLLEAARFIELQEQRERLTSTSSTASSLSTSPHSNSRYQYQSNFASHQSLGATPPASPLSDIPRSHIDYISSNGTTITRNGKCFVICLCFLISLAKSTSIVWKGFFSRKYIAYFKQSALLCVV